MDSFTQSIETKMGDSAKDVNIPDKDLIGIPQEFLIGLEKEDDEFYHQFMKVINDASLLEADDKYNQEFGRKDNYIVMKLEILRGPDGDVQQAYVKK